VVSIPWQALVPAENQGYHFPQAVKAHLAVGVALPGFNQLGQELGPPRQFVQLFPEPGFMPREKFPALGWFAAAARTLRHGNSLVSKFNGFYQKN
jgi:hypothetical protein